MSLLLAETSSGRAATAPVLTGHGLARSLALLVLLGSPGALCVLSADDPVLEPVEGIWTSAAELQSKPMEGPAWEAVWRAANQETHRPDVGEQEDPTNVRVLAAAIVYARTGDRAFRDKVIAAIEQLVAAGKPAGTTLAWGREVGAYAMAADLVGYRTAAFEQWLGNIAETWKADDDRTLRETFHQRPNNWGAHAFGSLCAIYRYLDEPEQLNSLRAYWIQGVTGPNPGYRFGDDLSWHPDPHHPHFINPVGATIEGFSVDGLIPDDMRRGGPFQVPPVYTNYAWEVLQGQVMAARILERAGMPIWEAGDQALYRAIYALQVRLGPSFHARGDDLWMLPFFDRAYGTNWSEGQGSRIWSHGKNAGWPYVLED